MEKVHKDIFPKSLRKSDSSKNIEKDAAEAAQERFVYIFSGKTFLFRSSRTLASALHTLFTESDTNIKARSMISKKLSEEISGALKVCIVDKTTVNKKVRLAICHFNF